VVPLIAQLTKDTELGANLTEALRSIDLVYRAREHAAEAIVRELFSGQINLDSDELHFELGGTELTYSLHRVNRLAGIQEVPVEIIGQIGHLADLIDAASKAPA
jgi:hypothetical protein